MPALLFFRARPFEAEALNAVMPGLVPDPSI